MLEYDKHKWWVLLFAFRGTVIQRMMVRIGILLGLTVMLCLLQYYKYQIPNTSATIHTLLGTALGLLLVFRTNASYDRYWEGRKLLGSVVTQCRSLTRAAATYCKSDNPECLATLVRYISAFAVSLKFQLRQDGDTTKLIELKVNPEEMDRIIKFHNRGLALLFMISKWIDEQVRNGSLERWQARSLEQYVSVIGDSQGGLERILKTPIPFAYAVHTHQFLWLYLLTLPFTMVVTYQYYALVAVFTIGFGLIGIDEAGVEIEDPFGTDDNDLPLDAIFGTIIRDAEELTKLSGAGGSGAGNGAASSSKVDLGSSNSLSISNQFTSVKVQEHAELLDPE